MLSRCVRRIALPALVSPRSFHPSVVCFAKKNKGKESQSSTSPDESVAVLPDVKALDAQMQKRLTHLKDEFAQIRGGSVNKDMLNSVVVSAYGSRVPLTEAGQITLKNTNSLAVAAFDAGMIPFIVTALRDSDLNISPVVEGGTVVVNVPKPSKEARELQVKMVGKISEKTKQEVRNVRKDGLDVLKKAKGKVSEDDTRRLTKNIDVIAEQNIERVVKMQKDKEKELLNA